MSRANGVLLLGLAAFLGWASLTGRVGRCVAPRYAWLTPFGAVLMGGMGLAAATRRRGGAGAAHGVAGCGCGGAGGHADGQGGAWLRRTLIPVPFVLALVVDPSQLTPEGIRKRQVPGGGGGKLPLAARDVELERAVDWVLGLEPMAQAGGRRPAATGARGGVLPPDPTVRDLLRAADTADRGRLDGLFVSLLGQADPAGSRPGRFGLTRIVVVCCIADATAVSVDVVPLPGTEVRPGEWLRVGGLVRFDAGEDAAPPVLHAASVERVPPPSYPYL